MCCLLPDCEMISDSRIDRLYCTHNNQKNDVLRFFYIIDGFEFCVKFVPIETSWRRVGTGAWLSVGSWSVRADDLAFDLCLVFGD